jgi:spore maturation protein B
MSELIVPIFMTAVLIAGCLKRTDVSQSFLKGAKENLRTAAELLPTLILLMTAVNMFIASGAPDCIAKLLSPVTKAVGLPDSCVTLAAVRPISGSGALAVLDSILSDVSPDSLEGRVASVLMGSTETTFYNIAVYFSAINSKPDKRIFLAATAADLTGFILAPTAVRIFFG